MAKQVSNWFVRIWQWKKQRQEPAVPVVLQEEHLTKTLGRFEPYVVKIQKVLIWENPVISILSIFAVNVLYWLLMSCECRFYGILYCALLSIFLYDVWVERIWPAISVPVQENKDSEDWTSLHPSVLSVPEISHYLTLAHGLLREYYIWLKTVRSDQPGLFCAGMSCCFLALTLIGRAIPGSVIAYILLMLVMIGPGIFIHLLPLSVVDKIRAVPTMFGTKKRDETMDSEGEDYMPQWTGENLALLNSAGDQDSDKDEEERDESNNFAEELTLDTENGDSTGTQLSLGADVGMMPSHDSVDGLDVSEFEISAPTSLLPDTGRLERQLDPDASDSDDEDIAGIQFQSSHFNGDSSEEEEKVFTQGLAFTDNQQNVDSQAAGKAKNETVAGSTSLGEMLKSTVVQAVTKNITDLGVMSQSLFSTVMNSGVSRATTPAKKSTSVEDILSSDDDSDDFEIISQDDLS